MMNRGRTLWEMLTDKLRGTEESRHYNPLHAKIGCSVMLNEVELKDLNFFIQEIREVRRQIGPNEFFFADYVLLARPLGGKDVLARLRLNPSPEADAAGGPTHQALLLRLDDEMAYDEGLHKVVTDTTRQFQIMQDGKPAEEFWRINDVTDSYKAEVTILRDTNHDTRVTADEVQQQRIEYWDYWRQTTDEVGQPLTEYLFVEMDRDNGWFQIWRGREMDPQRVFVI